MNSLHTALVPFRFNRANGFQNCELLNDARAAHAQEQSLPSAIKHRTRIDCARQIDWNFTLMGEICTC